MAFDPDAFLAATPPPAAAPSGGFDPDAFLAGPQPSKEITVMDRVKDFVGGINTSLFDLADLPANLVNAAAQTVGVPDEYRIGSLRDTNQFFQDATKRHIPKGQSAVADALRTGAEWGGTGIASPKLAQALPDVLSGAGAMIGEQVGGDTGKLIGGITGALSPAAYRRGKAELNIRDVDEDAEAAKDFLLGTMTDAKAAIPDMQAALARGEKGSLSDLTRDSGLAAAERAATHDLPRTREALRPIHAEREAQIAQQYDSFTPEVAGATAPQAAGQRLNKTLSAIQQQKQGRVGGAEQRAAEENAASLAAQRQAQESAAAAEQQALQADANMGGTVRTDVSSTALSEEYQKLSKELRANLEKPAWDAFDGSPPIEISDMQKSLAAAIDAMPRAMADDLVSKYRGTLKHIGNWRKTAEPAEVQYVLSAIKDINNTAKTSGDFGVLNKQLSELGGVIDSKLRGDVGAFADAVAATKKKHEMLGGPRLKKALLKDPELFASSAGFKGDKGAVTMRNIGDSESPEILQKAEAHLRDLIRKEGVTQKTLDNYAPALAHPSMVGLRQQLEAAVNARGTADIAGAEAKEAAKVGKTARTEVQSGLTQAKAKAQTTAKERSTTVGKLPLAQYAREPRAYISKLLNKKDFGPELASIQARMVREGKGDAFKADVMGLLKDRVLAADNFDIVAADVARLQQSKILTDADVTNIKGVIDMSEGRRLRGEGGKVKTPEEANRMADDVASSVLTIPALAVVPSGHRLMASGVIKRTLKQILRERHADPAIARKLEGYLKSPELFNEALKGKVRKDSTPEDITRLLLDVIKPASHTFAQDK